MLSYRSVALLAISLVVASIPPAFGEVAIGGRITLADEGFEGARVVLLPLDGRYQAGRALMDGEAGAEPVDETRTDGDGRFRLEAPEPGGWTVRVEAPDHLPAEAILRPLVEANELPTLELEAAQAMVVRIAGRGGEDRDDEDRDDGDVTRIAVEPPAQRQWQRSLGGWATPVRLAQTDADGVARLPVAAGEKVVLWADVPGSPRLRREVRAGKGVTLKPLGGIEHRVRVTVGRRGVAKALIFGKRGIIPLALTDSEGRATLTAPTDSALTLLALGPEGHRGSHSLEPPREDEPAREETIELAEPDWLSGQVVEHETRRPIPGAWMWQHRVDSDLVRTDARGGFRVPVPETATNFGAIALGYAAGGAAWQRSESSDLTLVLHPSASLSGVVVDSAGRPVGAAEAWLVVHRTAETRRSLRWFQRWLSRGEGPVTRSTRDGRFRLAGLPAGASYHLTWVKAGFVPTPVKIEPLEAFEHRDRLRM
ncbi:MAG: carboxypeptidase-like regulatory domain-containing protein, partial [Acidobacteriota bacterium]